MILAGDIGATKTLLALLESDPAQPVLERRFVSREYSSLTEIVAEFLADTDVRPAAATFGIPGRVRGRQAHTTNLPWLIDADAIEKACGIIEVRLLNDVQAMAAGVPHLPPDSLEVLNGGRTEPHGTKGVVAPGTGLGESFLTWSGKRYQAWPSEGGHVTFAPVTEEQAELRDYLALRYDHVSFERVCSGSAIPDLYAFQLATRGFGESAALQEAADPTAAIVGAALSGESAGASAALDLFVSILGNVVGNMALRVVATGGLYIGGGIPPRVLPRLREPAFLEAVSAKGRFREWLSKIPIAVILDEKAALHGAAWEAIDRV